MFLGLYGAPAMLRITCNMLFLRAVVEGKGRAGVSAIRALRDLGRQRQVFGGGGRRRRDHMRLFGTVRVCGVHWACIVRACFCARDCWGGAVSTTQPTPEFVAQVWVSWAPLTMGYWAQDAVLTTVPMRDGVLFVHHLAALVFVFVSTVVAGQPGACG
jgi:hypothetical protein